MSAAALALLAAGLEVPAQEGGDAPPPQEAVVPPPAGQDVETLRKLLGLPAQAPAAAPAPAPAAKEEAEAAPPAAPEPAKAAPAAKAPTKSKPKPVAKAPAKKPAKPVVKAAPKPSAPAEPEKEAEAPAEEEVEASTAPEEGSVDDVPPPGTVVAKDNLERWKHVLGPSIQWAVSRGAKLPVVEGVPTPMEPFRDEATQRYSPQVSLTPDKNAMRNYVAGIPFPMVTDDDPDVAIKMMFNFEARIVVDDVAVRNFNCDTGRTRPGKGFELERHYVIDSFRRLFYVSRFKHDPKPVWQTPDGVRYRELLGPLHEPFDLKGAGFTYIRYLDPSRHDDSWIYFPQFKRVRRLSTSQRSEGVFGQDVDLDSYVGYAGNPAWSHWTYLGKKKVLGMMNARNLPGRSQPAPADFFPDDAWETREVYVLLAVSKLGGYNFGQRVIYVDRESWLIPYTEIYDLKGALWKSLVQAWKFGKKPFPEAQKAVYEHEQFYLPTFSMIDIQQDHVTKCFLPSADEKGEESWFYYFADQEGTTEDIFSVSQFIEQGR